MHPALLRARALRLARTLLPLLLLAASPARSRVLYVNRAAPGPTHDGLAWATAFTEIGAALDAAADGDELWVAKGVYGGGLKVTADVALYGGFAGTETERDARDPRENATNIQSGPVAVAFQDAGPDAALDGFTVFGGMGMGVWCSGPVARIANNIITDTKTGQAGPGHGIVCEAGATPDIQHNVVTGNAGFGLYGVGARFRATGNRISGNGGGVGFDRFSTVFLVNNTIVENSGPGVSAAYYSSATVANNIIAYNKAGVVNDAGRPSVLSFTSNDVFGNTDGNYVGQTDPTGGNGNISAEPLFVDRPDGDLRLTLPSPAVDAGADNFVTAATDLGGGPRIQAVRVDMGAYEYTPLARLGFTTQPTGAKAGERFAAQPVVAVMDEGGHVVSSYNAPVTLSLASGPSTGHLTGTTTVNAVNGVATFTNVGVDRGGTYVLRAEARAIAAGTSEPVLVHSLVVRVRPDGNDGDDGETWATAKRTVQAALAQAVSPGGEVWVAAGTYTGPFAVPTGVGLYGGFRGVELQRAQRDFGANAAVLKGDGGPVVRIADGAASATTVDGFTITGGTAETSGAAAGRGGGIVCLGGAPAIRNNVLNGNSAVLDGAAGHGGGVYLKGSGWVVENNALLGNSAAAGGGLYAEGAGTIANNMVRNNAALAVEGLAETGAGGGIAAVGAGIELTGNIVRDNEAGAGGGGIAASGTSLTVTFNDVTGNTAGEDGGGLRVEGSGVVRNNTFSGNTAGGSGGGLWVSGDFRAIGNVAASNEAAGEGGGIAAQAPGVDLLNNTVVANTAAGGAGGLAGGGAAVNNIIVSNSSGVSGVSLFRNNDVFGNAAYNYDGTDPTGTNGNISTDPLFLNGPGGDYHLRAYSPLIDAGYDAVAQAGDTDRDRLPRLVGTHVDIGAYEYPQSVAPGMQPVTFLSMHSVGPDYIGAGRNYLYVEDANTTFAVEGGDNTQDGALDTIGFSVIQSNYQHWWYPQFHTYRIPANLVPGYYPDAERAPFASAGHPGLSISGDGRGCNTLTGSFTVLDVATHSVGPKLTVDRFAATFEQHCEGGAGALVGTISYNSAAATAPYTMQDVVRSLAIAGGLLAPVNGLEATRYDIASAGMSAGHVDTADTALLLKKALGLEPNP